MENEQRVDLDVSETDESVGVRVGMDMAAENNDTVAELEPDSTTVEQGGGSGSGRGRGRRGRGNTTAGAGSEGSSSGRLVSDAWNHFKKVKLGKEVQAICNYCGLVMQGHYSQGTNHLINHAKRCPRRSIKNMQQMHLSFSSKADGTTVLSNYSTEPKWDMATVRVFIARMIVMHELPLSFVEYIGFYKLLKLLQPSIETISRNTIKAEILKLYDIEKTKAMSVLEACDSRIAVTMDMWTAGNQKKGYMVVTAHYIDNSWVLRSRIMRLSMNAWLQSPIEGVKNMATKMIAKYDKYWDVIHGVLAVGTLLDPRRKMLLINFLFPKIYGERAEFEIERVHKLFVDLVHEYEVKYSSNANWGVNGSASSEGAAADDSIMVDLDLDEMADEWESFRNQNSQNNHFKTKFELYLEESTLPSTSQFDILSWWKNNQGKYPILPKIARDFLAIPVSTVASESIFSTGGRHLSPHRSRLQPSTVEALVCTQNWFWLDHNLKDGIPEEAILSAEQLIDESLMSEL
ncbi:BED-type domain-containing protein [Citrus sinensis]|nr:BED-type domain-containing protein [Citrus sinensis]